MKALLAVEDSSFSSVAVEYVARCPWPEDTEINVFNVYEIDKALFNELKAKSPQEMEEAEEKIRQSCRQFIDRTVDRLKMSLPELSISGEVRMGLARDTIMTKAADWNADLIIMGSHGRTGIQRFLLGSVAESVLDRAGCSVLIVKDHPEEIKEGPPRVLAAVEDENCVNVLSDFISRFPLPEACESKIVHVVSPVLVNSYLSLLPSALTTEISERRWSDGRDYVKRLAARIKKCWRASVAEEIVVEGDAKMEILHIVEKWKPNMVLLGSHRKRGIKALGSVSRNIVAHSPCSTTVVPLDSLEGQEGL